jgi:hypothetical protein
LCFATIAHSAVVVLWYRALVLAYRRLGRDGSHDDQDKDALDDGDANSDVNVNVDVDVEKTVVTSTHHYARERVAALASQSQWPLA